MPLHTESIALLSPPFLLGPNGSKYMSVFGQTLNDLENKLRDASKAHMPGQADASAIPLQAADRGLVQGPMEPNDQFIARLSGALDAWAHAGARRAILAQLHAYFTGLNPGVTSTLTQLTIVGTNASTTSWDWYRFGDAQNVAAQHELVSPENWNWDGAFEPWRQWLVLFMQAVPTGLSGSAATVSSTGGSGVAGVTTGFATITGLSGLSAANEHHYLTLSGADINNTGTFQITHVASSTQCTIANPRAVAPDSHNGAIVWSVSAYPYMAPAPVCGSPYAICNSLAGVTPPTSLGVVMADLSSAADALESVRAILRAWKSAGAYYQNIIVSFGQTDGEFLPTSSAGFGNPTGNWGYSANVGQNQGGVWANARVPLNLFTVFPPGTGRYVQCTQENVT